MKVIELFDEETGRKVAEIPALEVEEMNPGEFQIFCAVQDVLHRTVGVTDGTGKWENGNLGGKWGRHGDS